MRTALILIALLFLLHSPRAHADCMASRSFIVPVPGTKLPPDPVLYAFVPEHIADPGAYIEGAPGASIAITPVSVNDSFKSFRLDVKQKKGKLRIIVSMRVGGDEVVYADAIYTIDTAWKPPLDEAVEVEEITKEVHVWECSHNATYNLRPSVQAMAYRVEWAETQEDFASGKRESAVFPYSLDPFFTKKPEPASAIVKLGHANCLYNTFRWPAAHVYVGLVALHPDGSETPASAKPAEVPWSFGDTLYGAMTDAFREKVHGKDDSPAKEQKPAAKPVEKKPVEAKPAVKEKPSCGCSMECHGGSGTAPLMALLVLVVLAASSWDPRSRGRGRRRS